MIQNKNPDTAFLGNLTIAPNGRSPHFLPFHFSQIICKARYISYLSDASRKAASYWRSAGLRFHTRPSIPEHPPDHNHHIQHVRHPTGSPPEHHRSNRSRTSHRNILCAHGTMAGRYDTAHRIRTVPANDNMLFYLYEYMRFSVLY